jgi:hypothetical protein
MRKLFAWIGRNEKHLSAAAFVVSFVVDLVGYQYASLDYVALLFTGMFLTAAVCVVASHYLHRDRPDAAPSVKNPFYTLLPIVAQFFTGGLLSGCLILYTRSADVFHSWPFIAVLAIVFVGNELFSKYRERLSFQSIQLFFALYLYAIFELPVERGVMSRVMFVESGIAALIVFAAFLGILYVVGKKRLMQSLRRILLWCGGIFVVVNLSYFTGILPPLPLTLKDAGIYHSLSKVTSGYQVAIESGAARLFGPEVIHHVPGTALYAYSAVFAPVKLTTPIVHKWERYDDVAKKWVTMAAVAFPVSGGRDGGYRGYSELSSVTAGSWRVSIETASGSVLGTERFEVVDATTSPAVYTEIK